MILFNNQAIDQIETLANGVEQKVLDGTSLPEYSVLSADGSAVAAVVWLSAQLTKQKKLDFKPKNEDLSFARMNTEPCVGCCELLTKVRDAAKENLSGQNLESFLTEVGVTFHR